MGKEIPGIKKKIPTEFRDIGRIFGKIDPEVFLGGKGRIRKGKEQTEKILDLGMTEPPGIWEWPKSGGKFPKDEFGLREFQEFQEFQALAALESRIPGFGCCRTRKIPG